MTSIEITIVGMFYILGLAIAFFSGKISGIKRGIHEAIKIMHEITNTMRGDDNEP